MCRAFRFGRIELSFFFLPHRVIVNGRFGGDLLARGFQKSPMRRKSDVVGFGCAKFEAFMIGSYVDLTVVLGYRISTGAN